jgi:hypothetical protein
VDEADVVLQRMVIQSLAVALDRKPQVVRLRRRILAARRLLDHDHRRRHRHEPTLWSLSDVDVVLHEPRRLDVWHLVAGVIGQVQLDQALCDSELDAVLAVAEGEVESRDLSAR